MSLYDKLMAVDDSVVREERTEKVRSERLSKLLGVDTDITVKALPYRQVAKIMDAAMKDNGRIDADRGVDAKCHLIRLAVDEIKWGDDALQKKFGASDPKDLVEKMLDYDIGTISDAVLDISGYGDNKQDEKDKLEEEVKN